MHALSTATAASRNKSYRVGSRVPRHSISGILRHEGNQATALELFAAFDLLYRNGYDLRREPLRERKIRLQQLIAGSPILLSEHFDIDGAELFKRACIMGLEGIVSKQGDGRYLSNRTDTWRKVTCRKRETLRIVGYALKDGRFDGLYLGRESKSALIYAGKVNHGFSREIVTDVVRRMKPLIRKSQAYTIRIKKPKAVWVEPELLAESPPTEAAFSPAEAL